MEIVDLGPERNAEWDAFAARQPESGFMQSSEWMRFKRLEGYEVSRLGLIEEGALCGGGALLYYPGQQESGLVVCPEGPVLPWQEAARAREGLKRIMAAARDWHAAQGALGIRIEPHLPPPAPSLLRNWTRAPVCLTPMHTPILDLTLSDEEMLARMRPKGRYNLRLSHREGVEVVRSVEPDDLKQFYALFRETAGRDDFFGEPYGYFLNLAASLFPTDRAALLMARHQGETIASIIVVFYGLRATYLYGGSSIRRRNVMPNYALQWAAVREARAMGCREYDLYGYDPFGQPEHPYAGITRFKNQFGPIRRDWIGAYDYLFYDRLADTLVDRLRDAGQ
jgi:lipid II:glycine glycyltransferase (peptidoglycan interpeptide bridge formation enzyme)